MRPLKDRILVERVKKEESKKGSLLLINDKPEDKFIILSHGKDVSDAVIGEIIMVAPYALVPIKNDEGRELFVIKENEILLVY